MHRRRRDSLGRGAVVTASSRFPAKYRTTRGSRDIQPDFAFLHPTRSKPDPMDRSEVKKMRNVLIAAVTAMALITGSLAAAAPASAGPPHKVCWYYPSSPICL